MDSGNNSARLNFTTLDSYDCELKTLRRCILYKIVTVFSVTSGHRTPDSERMETKAISHILICMSSKIDLPFCNLFIF